MLAQQSGVQAMKYLGFAAMAALAASIAAPAFACSPVPPPPLPAPPAGASQADVWALEQAWGQAHAAVRAQEDAAWRLKQQVSLFDEAMRIAVVRYVREDKVSGMPKNLDYLNGNPLVVLKPVHWVKGTGSSDELKLSEGMAPPCGWTPAHDAFHGKPDEVFLLYLAADGRIMEGFRIDRITEPRTLAALTAQ